MRIKLSVPRIANEQWQEIGPCAWDEMIQQSELLRSRIIDGSVGFPTHYQPIRLSKNIETGKTCTKRKTIFKASNPKTQIMEAKYFCILAYISIGLITRCLSHRQELWPSRAIHSWTNRPGLIENNSYSMALKFLKLSTSGKWLSAGLYRQEDKPSLPHQLSPKTLNKYFPGLQH